MRTLFDLLKVMVLGALLIMLTRCDEETKDKYRDTEHHVRKT